MLRSPSMRSWARALASAALLLTGSCGLLRTATEAPGRMLQGDKGTPAVPPSMVQASVMRFADTFATRIAEATQEFAEREGTEAGHVQALAWRVAQTTAAFTIASGSNPNANLVDMVMLVTLGRIAHEQHWMPQVWGEADLPMLEMFQRLEGEAWEAAADLLSPEQQAALKQALADWRAKNPDLAATAFERVPAFKDLFAGNQAHQGVFTELGKMVSLDPLAGLEPTTREIEQTRLLAERSLFYLQRMPLVLPSQVELLVLRLSEQPGVSGALEDTRRVSEAAASFAATAAGLPEAVRAEREAAVEQVARELEAQRAGLIADLEAAEEPAGKLLVETRSTLEAGTAMSVALEGAIGALDGFVGRFQSEEPAAAEPAPPAAPEEPGKPFDIAEYGAAAERVGAAAHELTALVATLEQSLPEARTLMDEAAQRGERAIDHAFRRGLALGLILIAAATLGVLLVRRTRAASGPAPPPGA